MRPLLWAVVAVAVIEGVVIDFLIGLLTPSIVWPVVAAAVHVYAVCWLLGILASFRTRPHEVGPDRIMLRNSIFTGVEIPVAAIESAQVRRTGGSGFSGVTVDEKGRSAVLGHGDTTVLIHLSAYEIAGCPVTRLDVTADDPSAFVRAIRRVTEHPTGG